MSVCRLSSELSRDEQHRYCCKSTCIGFTRSVRLLSWAMLPLVAKRLSFSWSEVSGGSKIKKKKKKTKQKRCCPHWSHFLLFTANSSVLSSYFSPRAAEHRAPGLSSASRPSVCIDIWLWAREKYSWIPITYCSISTLVHSLPNCLSSGAHTQLKPVALVQDAWIWVNVHYSQIV